MSVTIFAAAPMRCGHLAAAIPGESWEPLIHRPLTGTAEDDDASPIPNPHHVPDAALNVSNANAEAIRHALGLAPDAHEAAIEAVQAAAMRWLNSAAARNDCGVAPCA
jgi:hypothetical protein